MAIAGRRNRAAEILAILPQECFGLDFSRRFLDGIKTHALTAKVQRKPGLRSLRLCGEKALASIPLLRLHFPGFFYFVTTHCQHLLNKGCRADDLQQKAYALIVKQVGRDHKIIALPGNGDEVQVQRPC